MTVADRITDVLAQVRIPLLPRATDNDVRASATVVVATPVQPFAPVVNTVNVPGLLVKAVFPFAL